MRYSSAILLGRLVRFAVRLIRPGGGSALPGLIASKIAPNLVAKTLSSFPKGYVAITGTAGKSTTTKMVVAIVRAHGLKVFTNPSTANIEQGFFSTIVRSGNLQGRVAGEIAILEMDEAHAAKLSKAVAPKTTVILNVLEDQLDRFIDPALVRQTLSEVAANTTGKVLLNADDQNCRQIAKALGTSAQVDWFGFSPDLQIEQGLLYARTYLPEIPKPETSFELIRLEGRAARAMVRDKEIGFDLPSRGQHFALDAIAALACAEEILGSKFDGQLASQVLSDLPPVFSRGETREIGGQPVEFILVQNPASLQLNLDNLSDDLEQVFFAIGRDVHDPSWLWTVDYRKLKSVEIVSGFNFADAALVLIYNEVFVRTVEPDFHKAIDAFLALPSPKSGVKTVIYSADAMRRLRRYLGFTDPEEVTRG